MKEPYRLFSWWLTIIRGWGPYWAGDVPDVIKPHVPSLLVINQNQKRGHVSRLMTVGLSLAQYGPHQLIIVNHEKSLLHLWPKFVIKLDRISPNLLGELCVTKILYLSEIFHLEFQLDSIICYFPQFLINFCLKFILQRLCWQILKMRRPLKFLVINSLL